MKSQVRKSIECAEAGRMPILIHPTCSRILQTSTDNVHNAIFNAIQLGKRYSPSTSSQQIVMPDIFISYSSRDRAGIAPLVEYFETAGLEVWWDRHINAGSSYAKDIEDALDSAKAVVVVWSRHSVQSDWVRAEANEGHTRGILVPLLIDDARPPLIFRSLQTLKYRLGNEADLAAIAAAVGNVAPALARKQVAVVQKGDPLQKKGQWTIPPFIGRDSLLQSLEDRLALAASGSGQAVLLSGDPGMGKSRTAQELAERAKQRGITVCAAWAEESMYAPAYWPIIRLLRAIIGDLNPPLQREDLGTGGAVLSNILPELREMFSDLGASPDHSAEQLVFELGQALLQLLNNLSRRRPVLFLFDDLHCADSQTTAVLLIMARELNRTSVMFLGNFREKDLAEDHELRSGLSSLTKALHFQQHELKKLPQDEAARFLEENVNTNGDITKEVIAKADGNPLFLTELGRSINSEAEKGTGFGLNELHIPRSLQSAVLDRVRGLTPDCRDLLDIASVMGRTLSPNILCVIRDASTEETQNLIAEASGAGIIDIGPSGRLRFTHILLRDTLYQDLNPSVRMQWHRTLSDYYVATEESAAGVASHCETIAHHYQLCGLTDHALAYWEKAANIAKGQSAYADSIVRLNRALELLEASELPPRERIEKEVRLRLSLGNSIVTLEGSGASKAVPEYERAMALCNTYPDSPSLFYALNAVWSYHAMHCSKAAIPLVERQLSLANRLQSDTTAVLASNAQATTQFFQGDFGVAIKSLQKATQLWQYKLEQQKAANKPTTALSFTMLSPLYTAWCLALMGNTNEALNLANDTLKEAREMGTYSYVQCLTYTASIYEVIGDYHQLKMVSQEIIQLAKESGYLSWLSVAHCTHGMAVARLDNPKAGLSEAWSGRETYEQLGGVLCLTWRQCQLAEILRLNTRPQDAIHLLDTTLKLGAERFEHFVDSEIYRIKGECMLELGLSEGITWIKRAESTAKATSAVVFQERATASLKNYADKC